MYHGLHAGPDDAGRFDAVYSVHPDAFARQLDWLQEQGYRSTRLRDIAGTGAKPDMTQHAVTKHVVITFDDGDVSNVDVALPLLQARGMVAEFFITTDFIGQPGMVSAADVRSLADAGMGVGSHGRSHAFLEDLDAEALRVELHDSRRRLRELCDIEIDALALPGGRGGDRERRVSMAAGYRHLLGSVPGPNPRVAPGHWLQRIAVTRTMSDPQFHRLVAWRGLHPRLARARFLALRVPKRVLGNAGYERLRARLL
jgi:peptidoglycan/xylan/chitin deacetylase (PgdA/CDA1 family)